MRVIVHIRSRWLRDWGPALVWAVMISVASTAAFGAANTAHFIIPVLHRLLPKADADALMSIHNFIRKSAHVIEFGVFAMLFVHGIRAGRREWRWTWVAATLLAVACYAGLDEFHQAFVPGRGASVRDVALDFSGGVAAIAVVWVWAGRGAAKIAGGGRKSRGEDLRLQI